MPRNFAGTSQFMRGTGSPFSGNGPGALLIWRRLTSINQQASQYLTLNDGTSINRSVIGSDITGTTSGKTAAVQSSSTTNSQALADTAQTANAWQLDVGAFGTYPNSQIVYMAGGHKISKAAIVNPATTTTVQIGGRGTQDLAHAAILTRLPTDLEIAACGIGLINPRALGLANYYYVNQTVTETDQVGSINLTVTGTSTVSGDPNIGTWFTGTAISNQSWTQGVAITPIDLTTKFDNGVATSAPWTGSIKQIGSAGTPTTASGGASTASTQLTTAAGLTAGQWVKIGSNPLTPILYASGNTALLQTAQTWNDTDTVTPYPVTALTSITSNGVTVNGSNQVTGTPTAGAVGSFANCCTQATNNTNSGAIAYSNLFSITVASSGAAPSFSSGPSVTATNTDGWAFGATSNQTATWYAIALLRGSATPTGAQVKSGSPTGFVSRFSSALTASVAGALTFTGLTFPLYDVYHVVDNGSGTSAVQSFPLLFKSPPAGKQYVTVSVLSISAISKTNPVQITLTAPHGRTAGDWVEAFGIGGMTQLNGAWGPCAVVDPTHLTIPGVDSTGYSTFTSGGTVTWGRSTFAGSSTNVVSGDILIADATDGQGAPVSFTPEGVALFATNSTARQSFIRDVYSVSLGNFIGSAIDYENDSPPIPPGQTGLLPFVFFPLNQSAANKISSFPTDPQGDDLTNGISALSALPPGRTLTAGVLSGIATANAITPVTFQAQNASTESTPFTLNVIDGGIPVPSGLGLMQDNVDDLAAANYLNSQFGSQNDPTPGGPAPFGTIIAQTPAPGTVVAPGTTVIFTASTGIAPITQIAVPDVSSSPIDQATAVAVLLAAGFIAVTGQSWTGAQKITQYPAAGSVLNAGSVVQLFLTGGAPTPRRQAPKRRVVPTQKPRTRIIIKTPGKNHR
jgi:hypothetical protein